jgi:hypothetical protein
MAIPANSATRALALRVALRVALFAGRVLNPSAADARSARDRSVRHIPSSIA